MKAYISELICEAVTSLYGEDGSQALAAVAFDISFPKPEFGDYATNAAMVLFKELKNTPPGGPLGLAGQLAEQIKQLDHQNSFKLVAPLDGFINFTLSEKFLLHRLSEILQKKAAFGKPDVPNSQTVIVEYFQNNVAKPPHVGHLRSAVIGDSLLRILRFLGYQAISDTHIGDWGVQFGILLLAYKQLGHREIIEQNPIEELNKLYVEMSARIEADPSLRDAGKAEFKKLETGDEENRELWQWFVRESLKDFDTYRELLGVLPFDNNLGESFYEAHMPQVLEEFQQKGLVTTGETGELYIDLETDGLGRCILVKSDGATTYHLRDFATYLYRKKEFNFYRNLYVVDNRQSHHFTQLFRVLEKAGYPAETDSIHIDFGFMSLPEGAISTRKGATISLKNLLHESEKRAIQIIDEKNPTLANKQEVAQQVARAAIKYFDLSHNRKTEIVFTWDKALSFDGNTGPYLQYTHARIHGILRKAAMFETGANEYSTIDTELELSVLRKIHQFPEVLQLVMQDFTPNVLCNYLFELSQNFNSFYEALPVLQEATEQVRNQRIKIITAVAQVLKTGLYLLGIEAPEEM